MTQKPAGTPAGIVVDFDWCYIASRIEDDKMTLIAAWYVKNSKEIRAIADSRLTSKLGVLTDQAPKFSTVRVVCHSAGINGKHYDKRVLDREIAIGFAGSASVAFSVLSTVQSYLSSLTLNKGSTPKMAEIAEFVARILKQNFRSFGSLWLEDAACSFLVFGYLPADQALKCYHVSAGIVQNKIETIVSDTNIVPDGGCISFGSGAREFDKRLSAAIATGNAQPMSVLQNMINDTCIEQVGGFMQIALAHRGGIILPHVITRRPDRDLYDADISFLGRDISEIDKIGDCGVGLNAFGPPAP